MAGHCDVEGAVALAGAKRQRLMWKQLLQALVAVPPQHLREPLPTSPVGQGLPSHPTTTKLALNPRSQPSEGVGGMLSRPLEWFGGSLQGKASGAEGLASQEQCGGNCWSQTGRVMERDQQAFAGNPAKDRDHSHSCASRPSWLPEAQQGGLRPPQPQAMHGVHRGRAGRHWGPQPPQFLAVWASARRRIYYAQYTSSLRGKKSSPCTQAKWANLEADHSVFHQQPSDVRCIRTTARFFYARSLIWVFLFFLSRKTVAD